MRYVLVAAAMSVAVGGHASAQTLDMGATFHETEHQATRVVTWFDDSYAVTERAADGAIRTQLFDARTHDIVARAVRHDASAATAARMEARIGGDVQVLPVSAAHAYAADWDQGQVRRLWRDHRARVQRGQPRAGRLVLERGFYADSSLLTVTRPGRSSEPDEGIRSVATEFPGIIVIAQRDAHRSQKADASYSTFTARLVNVSSGREIGFVRWFAKARVITWKFPFGAEGVIMESRVPGGLTFQPSMAWANVQAMLFLGQSYRKAGDQMLRPAAARWAAGLKARTASAGGGDTCDGASDGCTGLHWLDGTAFRECCDAHDICFEADQSNCCTAWSWLAFWDNFECTKCNLKVVGCFASTAFGGGGPVDNGGGQGSGSCGDGDACSRCRNGDWCPPECSICGLAY